MPNQDVTTITNVHIIPKVTDIVLKQNEIFKVILMKSKKWDGGSEIDQPLKFRKGSPSIFFQGFDLLGVTQQNTRVSMKFYPKWMATNITLSETDIARNQNAGKEKIIDLLKLETESRVQDAADDLGNIFYLDGKSNGNKAFSGLGNIVDDGSNSATYGTLSRSTYQNLKAYVNNLNANISLLNLRLSFNNLEDSNIFPDIAMTDFTTHSYLESIIQTFQRNTFSDAVRGGGNGYNGQKGRDAGVGYHNLIWNGIEIFKDRRLSNNGDTSKGTFYMLNSMFLHFRSMPLMGEKISIKASDIEGNIYETDKFDSPFVITKFVKPYNQLAINAFVITGGELTCDNPSRLGKITNITNTQI